MPPHCVILTGEPNPDYFFGLLRVPPPPIFPSHFFLAGSTTGAERESRQARAFSCAPPCGRNEVERLEPAPALRTLPAEKMGDFPTLLCFQHVYAHSPRRCRTATRRRGFFCLAACFLQVRARKPGNCPFFALLPPSSLIPCALTHVNPKLLCSSLSGVTCHPYSPCASTVKTPSTRNDSFGRARTSPPLWRNRHSAGSGSGADSTPELGTAFGG